MTPAQAPIATLAELGRPSATPPTHDRTLPSNRAGE